MPDLQIERQHLALADQHIAEGDVRVAQQVARIERMMAQGHDTIVAQDLLEVLQAVLVQWREHRWIIQDTIARLTSELEASGSECSTQAETAAPLDRTAEGA